MEWKSEERKNTHYSLATDSYDRAVLDLADELGTWLEEEKQYRDFQFSPELDHDQIAFALVVLLSEWANSGLWEIFTPFEKRLVGHYVQIQNSAMQEYAANQNHAGEADQELSDSEE